MMLWMGTHGRWVPVVNGGRTLEDGPTPCVCSLPFMGQDEIAICASQISDY